MTPSCFIRLCLLTFLLPAVPGRLPAEPPFAPPSPVLLAQGGSASAVADGYEALFANPAGFSLSGRAVTLSSFSAWAYGRPGRFLEVLSDPTQAAMTSYLQDEIVRGGGGLGAAYGIGYVGHGLGLGLSVTADSFLSGPTVGEAAGDLLDLTFAFVAGFSLPVKLPGGRLHLGVDFRPMARVRAPADGGPGALAVLGALQSGGDILPLLGSAEALHGFGVGLDLGAIAELGDFRLGLSVRDVLGTRFGYSWNTLGEIGDSLSSSFNLPDGVPAEGEYLVPMRVNLGAAWHPDLGRMKSFIDPVFHADVQDIVGGLQEGRSFWTFLHLGAEVELLKLFELRAGLNQGWFTVGAGLELLVLDVNLAFFTRELGLRRGDSPSSGLVLEGAFRL